MDLRSTLLTLEKKEDYLNKKIEEETLKAKTALAAGGPQGKRTAMNAVRQKKAHEAEIDKISGMRLTLETQACRRRQCSRVLR